MIDNVDNYDYSDFNLMIEMIMMIILIIMIMIIVIYNHDRYWWIMTDNIDNMDLGHATVFYNINHYDD